MGLAKLIRSAKSPHPASSQQQWGAVRDIAQGSLAVDSVNRKLIRPSLTDVKEQLAVRRPLVKKANPPDQTNAENFYYMKQMQAKTPMVIVMRDGETLHGVIEWYDKCCLKFNREGEPNLLIFKSNIKYMHKAG